MVSRDIDSEGALIKEIAKLIDRSARGEDYLYEKNQYEPESNLKSSTKEFFGMSIDAYNESHRIDEYAKDEDSIYYGDDEE